MAGRWWVLVCVKQKRQKPSVSAHQRPAALNGQWAQRLAQIPLSFEANRGQTDRVVEFYARGHGATLFLTRAEAVLQMHPPRRARHQELLARVLSQATGAPAATTPAAASVLRMRLAAANPAPEITGQSPLPVRSQFIKGGAETVAIAIPHYERVRYAEVYGGIDLVYHLKQEQIEYDFIVAPGSSPRQIELEFDGAERMELAGDGALVIELPGGQMRRRSPLASW